jgi:hypothetical protein
VPVPHSPENPPMYRFDVMIWSPVARHKWCKWIVLKHRTS